VKSCNIVVWSLGYLLQMEVDSFVNIFSLCFVKWWLHVDLTSGVLKCLSECW